MSSYVASCSMYCRADSSASGISASSPAATVASCSRCAGRYFLPSQTLRRRRQEKCKPARLLSGPVRYVVVPWSSSSVSRLLRSSSVPHRKPMPEIPTSTPAALPQRSQQRRIFLCSDNDKRHAHSTSARHADGSFRYRFRSATRRRTLPWYCLKLPSTVPAHPHTAPSIQNP